MLCFIIVYEYVFKCDKYVYFRNHAYYLQYAYELHVVISHIDDV